MGTKCDTCKHRDVKFNELPCRACWQENSWTPREEKENENINNEGKSLDNYTTEELQEELDRRAAENKKVKIEKLSEDIGMHLKSKVRQYILMRDADHNIDCARAIDILNSNAMDELIEYSVLNSVIDKIQFYAACLYLINVENRTSFSPETAKLLTKDIHITSTKKEGIYKTNVTYESCLIYSLETGNK